MSTDQSIFDFLAQPDNLVHALEIAEYVAQLKDNVHRRFWQAYNHMMKNIIHGSGYADQWDFTPYPTNKIKEGWVYSFILPNKKNRPLKNGLGTAFFQEGNYNNYRLKWGVLWEKDPGDFEHTDLYKLRAELHEKGIRDPDSNQRWIFHGYSPYTIYECNFLSRCYREEDSFVKEVADWNWNMFLQIRALLDSLNMEMYRDTQTEN